MIVVRCDGCDKVAPQGDATDWLRFSANETFVFVVGGPPPTLTHACSWECVAVIALTKSDLFEHVERAG